ncbi:MAG: UDP-N-acetylmuramate dehydrogenase [Bacteroidales bacterium]
MEIYHNYPLKSLNTFNIEVDAQYFAEVASIAELTDVQKFIESQNIPFLILGGGSNLLFIRDFKGLILKINLKGIDIISETDEEVFIKAGAGEHWDNFVAHCVEHGFGGLENLSLIPGCVGASPVQNIGAYGVEMKDFFISLEYYNFTSQKIRTFKKTDCEFEYRNSIFKNELKGKGVVTSVTFQLDKNPVLNLDYGSIKDELNKMEISNPTIKSVRDAVIRIRKSKLPDPSEIGNAGSFFKNPVVSAKKHEQLKSDFPI